MGSEHGAFWFHKMVLGVFFAYFYAVLNSVDIQSNETHGDVIAILCFCLCGELDIVCQKSRHLVSLWNEEILLPYSYNVMLFF